MTLVGAGLLVVLLGWVFAGRQLSQLLDRLHKLTLESQILGDLGFENLRFGILRINDLPLSTTAPDNHPYSVEMKMEGDGRLVVRIWGHAIALGRKENSSGGTVSPGNGDHARLQIEHSLLSWPTPFEFNFMTGQSPSWRRHIYYRLIWEKAQRGRLEMLWHYEQPSYRGKWASGIMTHERTIGLIRVDIRR
ncbi:MAG: hypothetical protein ABI787_06040 [Spartobacteria bacterium]